MHDFAFNRLRPSRHSFRSACQVVRERDFKLVADTITDLSLTGLLVAPADPVLTGEKLIVSFRLPKLNLWLDAEAHVARVVHGRRPYDRTRALGLLFEDLPSKMRFTLERLLRQLPLRPPAHPRSFPGRQNAEAQTLAFSENQIERRIAQVNPVRLLAAMSGQSVADSRGRLKSMNLA